MRSHLIRGAVAAVAVVLAGLFTAPGPALAIDHPRPIYVPGRLVVRFRAGTPALQALAAGRGATLVSGRMASLLPGAPRRPESSAAAERLSRTARVRLDPETDLLEAASEWGARPDVEYAGPVHLIPVDAYDGPSDPDLPLQWHHDAIRSRDAWQVTSGDAGTVIGIVDTGVDYNQADLKDNLWTNSAEVNGEPGVDDDGNGYVDDETGYDFTDVPEVDGAGDFSGRDPDPMDEVGHGTWVAGVACAAGNNGIGGAGVAFGARFMPLRAGFRPRNGFSLGFLAEDDAAAAVVYGVENGAQVLNLSFGDQLRAPILEDAVRYAIDRGTIVVGASGNFGDDVPFYPAGLTGVLAVGAFDRNGVRAGYSTWGPAVQLLAPGSGILTTSLGSGYAPRSGTSLAAPVAAGAAALLKSLHPEWSATQIIGVLVRSARAAGAAADAHGARFLDIGAAVHDQAPASILITGLDAGNSFNDEVVISGTVQGAGVRGWQVLVRRHDGEPWIRLSAEPHGTAIDQLLARWDVSGLPEGPATIRVEALGWDGPVLMRDVSISIDHSPPDITGIEIIPAQTGSFPGVRLTAGADEDVFGTLRLSSSLGVFEFRSVVAGRKPVLGLDGPLCVAAGEEVDVRASFVNAAGLETVRDITLQLPPACESTNIRNHPGPAVRTWLPSAVDLDGDGRRDLIGELPSENSGSYGQVGAWSAAAEACDTCAWNLEPVWQSSARYLPRDAADFDSDGLPEVLGLGFQEIHVYSRSSASLFPDSRVWFSGEAWPVRFIPAPDGEGSDIVATLDTEIRIYRRDGPALSVRQVIPNPTQGENSISPAIALVHRSPGGVSLATIDGDKDLFIVTRCSDGLFHPDWSRRLDPDYSDDVAAGDLDGDGSDELVTLETIGAVPSPAAGLRDGFYRLQVFRDTGDQGYSPAPAMSAAATGQFPGNSVSFEARDLDGDGRAEIWWGLHDHLYVVAWPEGVAKFIAAWEGVQPGGAAFGNISTIGDGSRNVLLFPGPSPGERPGSLFELSRAAAVPVALRLSVENAVNVSGKVYLTLVWNDAAAPYHLVRTHPGAAEPDFEISGWSVSQFRDTTLVAGLSYTYTVQSEKGGPSGTLAFTARVGNRITAAGVEPGGIALQWEFPVTATERASVRGDGITVSSVALDRTGRRLFIRTAGPMSPGLHPLVVTGYLTDPRYSVGPPDTSRVLEVAVSSPALSLRSIRVIDRNRLRVEFDPLAPGEAGPEDFRIEPGLNVSGSFPIDPETVELVLDQATPLRSGVYHLRVATGLTGPQGSTVQPGKGDILSFSVTPVAFPNPVHADQMVRFDWLSLGMHVSVYDLGGRPIWSGMAGETGILEWNLRDRTGAAVAPGVYLFTTEGVAAVSGKLAVIR